MFDFTHIEIGKEYNRPYLARIWGYQSFNAISRGVFTPANEKIIVFFITKEKQETFTQYEDHIEQDILFWEGEKGHGSDSRIILKEDEIHVFYRERHHSNFIYKGLAVLNTYHIFIDRHSKFTFLLVNQKRTISEIVAEIEMEYGIDYTERNAIISARNGQGLYRKRSINLWRECSLTGFTKVNILVASHIKPWKVSDNNERISAYNSLLLLPTVDKLFDKGYISFDINGFIKLSDKIKVEDYNRINVNSKLKLRKVPEKTKPYLEYHNEYVFDLVEK